MDAKLPKKILRIKDFTYILPDNFNGSFEDALQNFQEYNKQMKKPSELTNENNDYSATAALLSVNNESKACGAYGIFELDHDTGKYKLVVSSVM